MNPLSDLGRRVRFLITRGKVTLCTLKPVRALVQAAVLAGETQDNVELHLPYGMSARPKPGGDVIILMVGGTRTHLVALNCDDSGLRITDLQAGEFGFRDQNGSQVVFRQDRLEITSKQNLVATVNGDCDITASGNVNITGATVNLNP